MVYVRAHMGICEQVDSTLRAGQMQFLIFLRGQLLVIELHKSGCLGFPIYTELMRGFAYAVFYSAEK